MQAKDESKAEIVFGITAVLTAGGILTFALFPLILPGVVLLGVSAIPLLALAVPGAMAYGVYRIVRSISRRRSGSASRSISTIRPPATVNPATANGAAVADDDEPGRAVDERRAGRGRPARRTCAPAPRPRSAPCDLA